MMFVVGRIHGPEEAAERRLSKRIARHLDAIERALRNDFFSLEWQDQSEAIGDLLGELGFNLRRLIEIRRESTASKRRMLGYRDGRKIVSVWDFIGICQHLLNNHLLTGSSGRIDENSMMVIHSDRNSVGIYYEDLDNECRAIIARPTRPHYGLFDDLCRGGHIDEDGYPTFNFAISSRRSALMIEDFFWTPLDSISPGLIASNPKLNYDTIVADNPELTNDPIFCKASYYALTKKPNKD